MSTEDFLNSEFNYDANCPCNGCPKEGTCAVGKLACEDFVHYVSTGEKRDQCREPKAALYRKLFPTFVDLG